MQLPELSTIKTCITLYSAICKRSDDYLNIRFQVAGCGCYVTNR